MRLTVIESMMRKYSFDASESGLRKTLKEYQEIALRYLWSVGEEGAGSGSTWTHVKQMLAEKNESISRASIIIFLNDMVDQGVLSYEMESGKGGWHRVYKPAMDEQEYRRHILRTVIDSMMREYPEETTGVLKEFADHP
jgi:predicted transcriptional regulator